MIVKKTIAYAAVAAAAATLIAVAGCNNNNGDSDNTEYLTLFLSNFDAENDNRNITLKPYAPTGVTAEAASPNAVTLSWSPVSDAVGYCVYNSHNGSQVGNATFDTSMTITYLSPNTNYCYYVIAYNSAGKSPVSSWICATTRLNAPTGVTTTTVSLSAITMSWLPVLGATGYYVYNSQDGAQVGNATSDTSMTITELSPGTSYCYHVVAYNGAGNSPKSDSWCATVLIPPGAPTGVTVTATSSSTITVHWSEVSEAIGYRVHNNSNDSQVGSETSITNMMITGLSSNTEYCYYVVTYNNAGNSSKSDSKCAKTLK